ncbi:hypothetical protein [Pusillimonas sp. ANT_WB101]|uniref:hypothetical protein n=1 Tax=Pusillimonas sp. ANT_WB101 TaxID=2597356 RepID=UPI0011ED8284|nr:hypothetical protein [Pusillimonas sp. ANT_WB101]KAA0910682.1 hypothetical protein FQ179_02055 [Pusillimonas sp. ANT_WB101]
MPVRGIDQVKRNIKRAFEDIERTKTNTAVYAVLSQGGAMAATMIPVDTSTLINSHFVDIQASAGKTVGVTGYTAGYASAVHEASGVLAGQPRMNGNGQYWDPSGEPKFLTKGFEQIQASIPAILKAAYRVR